MRAPLLRSTAEAALSLLFPPHCCACDAALPSGDLCAPCFEAFPRVAEPRCEICSRPFDGAIGGTFTCANCTGRRWALTCAVAPFRSRGAIRDMIHRLKYRGELHLRNPLGRLLASALDDERLRGFEFDLILPVPLHPTRFRERGFNQAELLAEALARITGRPARRLLERTRYTGTQTALHRDERMENLRGAFRLRQYADVRDLRLLIVDDVLTTGATLDACAHTLREAGAAESRAAAIARG
jgi:ComF family protein